MQFRSCPPPVSHGTARTLAARECEPRQAGDGGNAIRAPAIAAKADRTALVGLAPHPLSVHSPRARRGVATSPGGGGLDFCPWTRTREWWIGRSAKPPGRSEVGSVGAHDAGACRVGSRPGVASGRDNDRGAPPGHRAAPRGRCDRVGPHLRLPDPNTCLGSGDPGLASATAPHGKADCRQPQRGLVAPG
jgi:hypothetical protein